MYQIQLADKFGLVRFYFVTIILISPTLLTVTCMWAEFLKYPISSTNGQSYQPSLLFTLFFPTTSICYINSPCKCFIQVIRRGQRWQISFHNFVNVFKKHGTVGCQTSNVKAWDRYTVYLIYLLFFLSLNFGIYEPSAICKQKNMVNPIFLTYMPYQMLKRLD